MGLPTQAIDRIFQRMAATYLAAWDRHLGSAPLADVKSVWASELSGFENRLQDIAWAFDNLPDRPPNAVEFKKLCRLAPAPETPVIEGPKADPERLKVELAKLGQIIQKPRQSDTDWAKRILNRVAAGDKITWYSKWSAEMALGQHGRQVWQ